MARASRHDMPRRIARQTRLRRRGDRGAAGHL
jgi:hypothetical protein